MKYLVKHDLQNLKRPEEVEEVYNNTPFLEIKIGIIHALQRGIDLTGFPHEWIFLFQLEALEDFLYKAHNAHEEYKRVPAWTKDEPQEIKMTRINQVNELGRFCDQCRKTAIKCLSYLLEILTSSVPSWSENIKPEVYETAITKVLNFMANWRYGPHLALEQEPQKKIVGKFLDCNRYKYNNGDDLPDIWYLSTIRSRNFHLLLHKIPSNWARVKKNLLSYLAESVLWETDIKPENLVFSYFGRGIDRKGRSSTVANFLIIEMIEQGELDEVVKFTT